MGARRASKRNLSEEIERVKRHIDFAVSELSEARDRMAAPAPDTAGQDWVTPSENEMANLCISLELALADSVVCAQRLAEKLQAASLQPA